VSTKKPTIIHKINHISEPLFIRAKLNNIDVPITIDTGVNIVVLDKRLFPLKIK